MARQIQARQNQALRYRAQQSNEAAVAKPIRNLTIVGGGTAGWLAAAMICAARNRRNAGDELATTLIESPTVGIGEATTLSMGWTLDLVAALETHCRPTAAVLVDCLTLWLSNLMAASRDIAAETTRLVHAVPRLEGRAVLVSNEVGFGIVPNHPLGREFRDHAGRLNQAVAAAVDEAVFMVAGLPLRLKP